ncbi:MAG: hypothetical protein ACXVAX_00305 [Pseudobdellovibrio sp.]
MKHLLLLISLLAGLNLLAEETTPPATDSSAPAANSSTGSQETSGAPAGAEDSFNYPAPADKTETQGDFQVPGKKRCLVCEAMQRKQKQLASDALQRNLSARGRQAVVPGESTTTPANGNNTQESGTDQNVDK